jgi:hypothetical protein
MPALYLATDPIEAQLLADYLAGYGIGVRIDGAGLWGARGELPLEYPRLYLLDVADESRARELLKEYERRAHIPSIWRCTCGQDVPLHFEQCWSCLSERPR